MSRIIINIRDNIDDKLSVSRVRDVISEGRISNFDTQYCYATVYHDNIYVTTVRTKNGTDVFNVGINKETGDE